MKRNYIRDAVDYTYESAKIQQASEMIDPPKPGAETSRSERDANEFAFRQVLNKVLGGDVESEKGIRMSSEKFISNKNVKDFLLGEKIDRGKVSPMEKAKASVQMLLRGESPDSVKRKLKNAEAAKEMMDGEKSGDKMKEGKDAEAAKEMMDGEKSEDKMRGGKDSGDPSGEEITAADIVKEQWTDLSKVKDMLTSCVNKVGFIKREGKLVERPGEITMRNVAKSIKDLQKATPELYAMPDMVFASKVATNEYIVKRKYDKEYAAANIVIVEDVSGSMRGEPEQWAAAAIITMLKEEAAGKMTIEDVILMGDRINPLKLANNKIAEYIKKRNHRYPGGTENQKAIIKAADMVKDKPGAEIVILTDGAFNISDEMMNKILDKKVKVHCLLVGDRSRNIKELCIWSGGKFENFHREY